MQLDSVRDPGCTACKLHRTAEAVCVLGRGDKQADVMVVGRMQDSRKYAEELETMIADAGIDPARVYFTQALKCRTFDQDPSNVDVKACRQYLDAEIEAVKPRFILTMGNEAMLAVTGHSGIMKWRAKVHDRGDIRVLPTIAAAAVRRNPGQTQSFMADLRLFANMVKGIDGQLEMPKLLLIDNVIKLQALSKLLARTTVLAYDIETNGSEEYDEGARMVSLAMTIERDDGKIYRVAIPLWHPESPFRTTWRAVVRRIGSWIAGIPKHVAHNGKFDARWLRHFGFPARVTFDTMLACHILDENRQKGLKPQAMSRLGVEPWAINTRALVDTPLAEVLEYNSLDTYYMYLVYLQVRKEIADRPRLRAIFQRITTPANEELIDIERRGIWVDVERLRSRKPEVEAKIAELEAQLMQYVPDPDEAEGWQTMGRRAKKAEVNFNPSNFSKWWLFDHLELPVLARGKDKPDGSEGAPSMAEDVMLLLKEMPDHHPVVDLLLERATWFKNLTFFNAYEGAYDDEHRIHTTFKLSGTVTGRLSSGKADADKVTAQRGKMRGVNLQQVPRDPLMRGLFGAMPGWSFVEFDFSQVELRVVAYVARVERMLRAYQVGDDLHVLTASAVTGLPPEQITKKVRKEVGKPVNFGYVYGMGALKFIYTAFNTYGVRYTQEEAQRSRRAYFDLYPELLVWHNRQRRIVEKYARVQSPIGRIRRLPDIRSGDEKVRAEAQRQAINSPIQGFASDMTQLSMVLALKQFRHDGMADVVRCLGSVHDALNWEIRDDALAYALPIIKRTMENLPFEQYFGITVDVPIVADCKVGSHWGDASELTAEEVYSYGA